MGVMPHSVQAYALDDPTAGAYGNQNFSDLRKFARYELANDTRSVVWHPETNYWVNVDVDVPLFLPVYGERRLHDVRLLLADVKADGVTPVRTIVCIARHTSVCLLSHAICVHCLTLFCIVRRVPPPSAKITSTRAGSGAHGFPTWCAHARRGTLWPRRSARRLHQMPVHEELYCTLPLH